MPLWRTEIVLDGLPITLKAPSWTVPLFASLVLDEPLARDGRDRLARGLWPDLAPGEARTNLRRRLSYLRKALEGIGIAAPGLGALEIGSDVVAWADARAFATLASAPARRDYAEPRTQARAGLRIFEKLGEPYLGGYTQLQKNGILVELSGICPPSPKS